MPRGKKARTDGEEKKEPEEKKVPEEKKAKGKGKAKAPPVPEVVIEKKKDTTQAEILAFLKENSGNCDCLDGLRDLILNSSLSRKLVNTVMSTIFEMVEATPAHFTWGKSCIQMITNDILDPKTRIKEAFFFPNPDSEKRLIHYLNMAERTMLVCVFTMTNDDLANALRRAKARGVDIRIISDDDLLGMVGSDLKALHSEGFQVRVDLDMHAHMHHKFAVIDDYILITGSFNWTKQAVNKNQENLVVMDDPVLAKAYTDQFNKMWTEFAPSVDRYLGGAIPVVVPEPSPIIQKEPAAIVSESKPVQSELIVPEIPKVAPDTPSCMISEQIEVEPVIHVGKENILLADEHKEDN